MKSAILVLVCLGLCYAVEEDPHHGSHSPIEQEHFKDGEHNADFDHQAILGSRDAEEEFEDLDPDEARLRLAVLVGKMDANNDGLINKEELKTWVLDSFKNLNEEEAEEKIAEQDENGDQRVSWPEYMSQQFSYGSDDIEKFRVDKTDEMKDFLDMVDSDKKKFDTADENGDGELDTPEYAAFMHPYDYARMFDIEVDRTMEETDTDKDGFISINEYLSEDLDQENELAEKEQFAEYDVNKDGVLDRQEIRAWVLPENDEIAEEEADHLIEETDANKDGILSKDEILQETELWVGSQATNYGQTLQEMDHDEL